MKKISAFLMALMVCGASAAFAEELELTGTVTATQSVTLSSPASGKVEACSVAPGDRVEAGDILLTLETVKVYAEEDGVIRTFGWIGDNLDTVTTRYGGVAYLEPEQRYTISASTKNAYSNDDNKRIHAGETVYLRASSNTALKAIGTVTAVSGTSFTVAVHGDAIPSSTLVYIFRDSAYTTASRIGSGSITQVSASVYTDTGYLVKWHVKSGDSVCEGDLLYEKLEGSFAPGAMNLNQITTDEAGVIASVATSKGKTVITDDEIIELYPDAGMRITVSVPESDLSRIEPGMQVQYTLSSDSDSTKAFVGTVEKISRLPDADTAYGTTYTVYIIPQSADALHYGMTTTVIIP